MGLDVVVLNRLNPLLIRTGDDCGARSDGILGSSRHLVCGAAVVSAHFRLGLSTRRPPAEGKSRLLHLIDTKYANDPQESTFVGLFSVLVSLKFEYRD